MITRWLRPESSGKDCDIGIEAMVAHPNQEQQVEMIIHYNGMIFNIKLTAVEAKELQGFIGSALNDIDEHLSRHVIAELKSKGNL